MTQNLRFKQLLSEGITSVARRQGKNIAAVERDIALDLGYSHHNIQYWRRGNVPKNADHIEFLVRYCQRHGRVDRVWADSLLRQARYPSPGILLDDLFSSKPSSSPGRTKLFISYDRQVPRDERVARQVSQLLSTQGQVFIDHAVNVSREWASRIEAELRQSDYLILFLSRQSVESETLLAQLEIAFRLSDGGQTRPVLLPVRLDYDEPLPDNLTNYLESIQWGYSLPDDEVQALVAWLERVLSSKEPVLSGEAHTSFIQGSRAPTISADSLYISRPEDQIALNAIKRQGITITIKGSRQMGKSALLSRVSRSASYLGKRVVFLDFQLLQPSLNDEDAFFRHFCVMLSYKLGIENRVDEYWEMPLPNPYRCTEYVGRYLLDQIERDVFLAMDNVDLAFDTPFRTDFFGMLRAWHNDRAFEPVWRKLDLALATSTEPYYFIDNLNQSPFNVGEVIELQDFTLEQVEELNERYGQLLSASELSQLMALLNGHPYLVRRALFLVAQGQISAHSLFAEAANERGPMGDHLRSLLLRLQDKPDLIEGLHEVVKFHRCSDEHVFFRLRGAGLVRRQNGNVVPRCQLYADFFQRHFDE